MRCKNNKIYNMTEKKYHFADKKWRHRSHKRNNLHSRTAFVSSTILKRSSMR